MSTWDSSRELWMKTTQLEMHPYLDRAEIKVYLKCPMVTVEWWSESSTARKYPSRAVLWWWESSSKDKFSLKLDLFGEYKINNYKFHNLNTEKKSPVTKSNECWLLVSCCFIQVKEQTSMCFSTKSGQTLTTFWNIQHCVFLLFGLVSHRHIATEVSKQGWNQSQKNTTIGIQKWFCYQ